MGYLPIVKMSAQFVAGLGVAKIVTDIVANNVTIVTTAQKVTVKAGSLVLSSLLVEQSSRKIERLADEAVAWIKEHKTDNETEK